MTSISIRSIGAFLPPTIRRNDYWSEAIVANWESRGSPLARPIEGERPVSEGVAAARRAVAALADDPFKGAVERRIMGPGEKASDMEFNAAKAALESAGLAATDVDALLVFTQVPDYLLVPHSALLHKR